MSVYRLYHKNDLTMFYIGSSIDMEERKRTHTIGCKTMDLKVYKYIREQGGWDNFEFEIVEECENYKERDRVN